MDPRRILIAVSGGIAAYKAPELVRALIRDGHSVRCVITPEAEHFVSPLVLQVLSGQSVRRNLFDAGEEGEIDHIGLADWADLIIVAPATANLLARMAHGIADDMVTAVLLASQSPILIAPAMNVNMWNHPATRANLATLAERGVQCVGPDSGELACGWEGEGRMSDPAAIVASAEILLTPKSLAGEVVLVTAGGTGEPVDTVRHLTNRSSGKMGFAIAGAAARRGASVILVAGLTPLETPVGVRRVDVETAIEMRTAVMANVEAATVVIKAAAVADFRPANPGQRKIKKEDLEKGAGLTLELIPNPDILAEVSRLAGDRIVIGFAAESHDVIAAARRKLARKGCNLLVANDVSRTDSGFNADDNAVSFVWPNGQVDDLALLPKDRVAGELLDRVEKLLGERS